MIPLKRVLTEYRRLSLVLGIALVANVFIYAVAIYPLTLKLAGTEARAAQAARERQTAEAAVARVESLVTGKARADEELRRFYQQVLPADLSGARRITYLRLAQLAEQAGLRYERRTVTTEPVEDSELSSLSMTMVLAGEYDNIRDFLYRLETSPEFVIIEDVTLAQAGDGRGASLVLTIRLTTYYRTGEHGT